MPKKSLLYAGAAVIALGLALAWAFAPRPLDVELASATEGRFETSIDEDGKTRLRERYVVSAPLAGQLARIAWLAGDAVEAGALLATLRPVYAPMTDERTRGEQQARVETAQGRVRLAGTGIGRAQVALRQADNELRRSEQLAAEGFVSTTQLDNARLARQAAQKDLEGAVQERRVAEAGLDEARAALQAVRVPASSGRDFAVRAPLLGRAGQVDQHVDALLFDAQRRDLGEGGRLDAPHTALEHAGTAPALDAHRRARRRAQGVGGEQLGHHLEPCGVADLEQRRAQRHDALAGLQHAQHAASHRRALGDGYRVGLRLLTLSVDKALRVPVSAVFPRTDGAGMAVFAVEDGRARLTPVELGGRNGTHAWIQSGLASGAQVIVYPPAAVRDGVRVRARTV